MLRKNASSLASETLVYPKGETAATGLSDDRLKKRGRPKPTPYRSPSCLLLFYTFLAGVIPDFAGFLAVLFVRDS
jgi:hypothetical protein